MLLLFFCKVKCIITKSFCGGSEFGWHRICTLFLILIQGWEIVYR
jgi:hypothetical protein